MSEFVGSPIVLANTETVILK